MRLIDELRAEHVLIERVAGSLRTFVHRRARGEVDPRAGDAFLRFFRGFSGGYHHAREENTLFPALVGKLELPRDRGPVAALLEQHHEMARTLEEMAPLLAGGPAPPDRPEALDDLARRYAHALWQHIDAENSVLFPESEERLRRAAVLELPDRPPTEAEAAARSEGERLVQLYPPAFDPEAIRGEGCVVCPSFGSTCGGVEREWWNDWEWEAFGDQRG